MCRVERPPFVRSKSRYGRELQRSTGKSSGGRHFLVIHDRKGQNSEGHAPQRLTQRLDRAQQTTNHTTACEALRSLLACLFVRRTGCRCDVSTGPRGGSWVRFPAGSARRDHPRPPQRRLLARTVRPRPGPRAPAPRSFTVYGFSVLHALRLLARPRSAAPRSSTLCGCVALVVVHGPGVVRRRMRSPRPWGPGFQWRGASAAFCVLLGVPPLDAR